MIACLRSTRFMMPDRSASVFLDLRRLQDIGAILRSNESLQFVVMKRLSKKLDGKQIMMKKNFDTLAEARRYWCEQAMILEDKGMIKMDLHICGFHEED